MDKKHGRGQKPGKTGAHRIVYFITLRPDTVSTPGTGHRTYHVAPTSKHHHHHTPHNNNPTANVTAADNNAMLPHTVAASAVTYVVGIAVALAPATSPWS